MVGHGAAREHVYKAPYDVHTERGLSVKALELIRVTTIVPVEPFWHIRGALVANELWHCLKTRHSRNVLVYL